MSPPRLGPGTLLAVLWALRRGFGGVLPVLERIRREVGDVLVLPLPRQPAVLVADPATIQHVLEEHPDAFAWRLPQDPVTQLFRRGVLVTDGVEHARLRGVLEPSNRPSHFLPRCAELWRDCDRILDGWRPGRPHRILSEMRRVALLAFERVYFSHDLWPELADLETALQDALRYLGPGWWLLRGHAPPPPRSVRLLDRRFLALARGRRAAAAPPDDLLTHLVSAFPDDDLVRDQLFTMWIAGHDTSTSLLTWSLHLLATHPRVQDQVRTEIRDVLGSRPPTPEVVVRLAQLDRVVREALRLYPPIHTGNRLTVRPVRLGPLWVPPGSRVLLSYFLAHRHPRHWPEPNRFEPARWAARPRQPGSAYFPFGAGPRRCLGASFAQLEVRLLLARVLQRFSFRPWGPTPRPFMGAALEPDPGVWLVPEPAP